MIPSYINYVKHKIVHLKLLQVMSQIERSSHKGKPLDEIRGLNVCEKY